MRLKSIFRGNHPFLILVTCSAPLAPSLSFAADYTLALTNGTAAWESPYTWTPEGVPGALDNVTAGPLAANTGLSLNGATSVGSFTLRNFMNRTLTFVSQSAGTQTLNIGNLTFNSFPDGTSKIQVGNATNRVTLNVTGTLHAQGGEIDTQNTAGNSMTIGTLSLESGQNTFVGQANAQITVTNTVSSRAVASLVRPTSANTVFSGGFAPNLVSAGATPATDGIVIGGRSSAGTENFLKAQSGGAANATYEVDNTLTVGKNANIIAAGPYTPPAGGVNALRIAASGGSTIFLESDLTLASGGLLFAFNASQTISGSNLTSNSSSFTGAATDELWVQAHFNSVNNVNAIIADNGSKPLDLSVFTNPTSASSVLQLGGANTFTGTTRIGSGFLRIGNPVALLNSTLDTGDLNASRLDNPTGVTIANGLTFVSIGGLQGKRDISLTNITGLQPVELVVGNSTSNRSTTFDGKLTGLGSLIKQGSGTLTLKGVNTNTGDTTVEEGQLVITQNNVLADTSTVNLHSLAALNLTHGGTDVIAALVVGGVTQPPGTYVFGGGSLQVPGGNAFATWATEKGLDGTPGKENGPADDPDKDGKSNLLEFAFNGNPLDSKDRGQVHMLTADSDAPGDPTTGRELILTIAVRQGAPAFIGSPSPTTTVDGVTYTIQGSLDLSNFQTIVRPVTPITEGLLGAGNGYEYRSFSLDGSDGLPGKGFMRAQVHN